MGAISVSNESNWKRARLIPVVGIKGDREAEQRATSALLAVLSIVRDFSHELLTPMGASSAGKATVWERFVDSRTSGEIDAKGKATFGTTGLIIRTRSVEADLKWLRWVFNWAAKWRTPQGQYLMRENPVRGYEIPTEKNPRRPVASADRYEAIRKISDQQRMEIRWNGKRQAQRSYLSELLDIVNGTGRRISAVCQLRYEDLRLSEGPYGSIRWPADTDKEGRESCVPINPSVRQALDRVSEPVNDNGTLYGIN